MKDKSDAFDSELRQGLIKWLLPLLLLAMFLAPRLPELGRFVTADEALWLRSSANYYYAVRHADWAGTFQSEHPGVSTMWAGAIGFHAIFPNYAEKGEAETSDFQLRHLLLRNEINPLEVLGAGRAVLVLMNAIAFMSIWPLGRRLFGQGAAFAGMGLLALDPFLIGHQRLLHQDGSLTTFMLLSLLAFLLYQKKRENKFLFLSAFSGGLAALTKSPGWFIFPNIVLLQAWQWKKGNHKKLRSFAAFFTPLLIWFIAALLTLALLYPAIWVQPATMLNGMLQYALDSAGGLYSGPVFFLGRIFPNADLQSFSAIFYLVSALWRSTPMTLFGIMMAAFFVLKESGSERLNTHRQVIAVIVFALGYTILMSLGTKKFDRYLLPALGPAMMVAGWGIAKSFQWLRENRTRRRILFSFSTLFALALWAQAAGLFSTRPYFINYFNLVLGGTPKAYNSMQMGWGEGMEQAASYLMQEVDIENKSVAAWYSTSFNLLFEHDADHIAITPDLLAADLDAMLAKDYLVIYLHQWQRGTPANLLAELAKLAPVFEAEIDGLPYVQIYRP